MSISTITVLRCDALDKKGDQCGNVIYKNAKDYPGWTTVDDLEQEVLFKANSEGWEQHLCSEHKGEK